MPFIPTPNVLLVELLFTYQGQEAENTLYFQRAEGWDADTIFAFTGAIAGYVNTLIMPTSPASLHFRGVKGSDLTTQEGASVEYTVSPPTVGGANVGAAPNNVSLAIAFKTAARGKTGRGRNYILGIQKDEEATNIVSQSAVDRWMSFYDEMISSPIRDVGVWVVVSKRFNKEWRAQGLARPVLTYGPTDNVVDSQRRRLPGRGT